jgi:uncharacterized membrane protein YvbJ
MYCPKCGSSNDDNNYRCVKCGKELPHGASSGANAPGENAGANQPPQHPSPGPHGQHEQQQYASGQQPPPRIENHMVKAILSTLLCCLPLGIAAIVYSAQVNSKVTIGDYRGAQESADNASMWASWSIGIGLGLALLYLVFGLGSALVSI